MRERDRDREGTDGNGGEQDADDGGGCGKHRALKRVPIVFAFVWVLAYFGMVLHNTSYYYTLYTIYSIDARKPVVASVATATAASFRFV